MGQTGNVEKWPLDFVCSGNVLYVVSRCWAACSCLGQTSTTTSIYCCRLSSSCLIRGKYRCLSGGKLGFSSAFAHYPSATLCHLVTLAYTEFQSLSLSIFPGEPGLAGFVEAKDDGSGDDNWSHAKLHHHHQQTKTQFFTVSKHWMENIQNFSNILF